MCGMFGQAHVWNVQPGPCVECSARGQGYVLAVWMSDDVCVDWNEPKACRA